MAKKATGKKKQAAEILDDNGTLIATASDGSRSTAGGAGKGKTPVAKRGSAKP